MTANRCSSGGHERCGSRQFPPLHNQDKRERDRQNPCLGSTLFSSYAKPRNWIGRHARTRQETYMYYTYTLSFIPTLFQTSQACRCRMIWMYANDHCMLQKQRSLGPNLPSGTESPGFSAPLPSPAFSTPHIVTGRMHTSNHAKPRCGCNAKAPDFTCQTYHRTGEESQLVSLVYGGVETTRYFFLNVGSRKRPSRIEVRSHTSNFCHFPLEWVHVAQRQTRHSGLAARAAQEGEGKKGMRATTRK